MAAPRQKVEAAPRATDPRFLHAAPLTKDAVREFLRKQAFRVALGEEPVPVTVIAAARTPRPRMTKASDTTGHGHPDYYYGAKQRRMNMDRAR